MPVLLKGSCHCGAVRFTVESHTPVPYVLCTCSICRKVGGVGGSINLCAVADTLDITQGKEHLRVYNAVLDRDTPEERIAPSDRNFCGICSAMLWVYDKSWPELMHPFASAIDSPPLEGPEELAVVHTSSKPDFVRLPEGPKKIYERISGISIESRHRTNGTYVP